MFLNLMKIPLYITLFRILCIPLLVVFMLSSFQGHELAAFVVFVVAALSDIADGVLARRTNQTSTIGALLDPIADKLLISSAFICLVGLGTVASWMVVIIIGREIAVTGFRAIASSRSHHIASSAYGRIKMWCESITIGLLILGKDLLGDFFVIARIGLWIVLIVVLFSAVEYFVRYGRLVLSD
ncbi:MAG: CDP-diacylglycerol--glycerol-3-phosphate 3-phosphatidyltransferase [Candidatus Aminicenantes bacterium]|nr:CDP-diacylglycerol--glycerol-3-phosphate 3-phosphatidyltransferase [Candidatus Aminicenantes bacterium]